MNNRKQLKKQNGRPHPCLPSEKTFYLADEPPDLTTKVKVKEENILYAKRKNARSL
ncbi:MAG: hypothetical protein KJ990_01380 [Proteobacteria bacterium]|nr:hypothetical protein [Pseudomonadota bacterium]MBU1649420.1 hypothetical protein [Pseudomonadota bacterium]